MRKQFTIKDLANKLGLHHTTVSRALRNHPDVNKKTKQMVLDAAKKYNYVPNLFAKSLRSSKSKVIVVMVPVIKNFFFSEVLGVISHLASEKGYSVMIYQSNEDVKIESQNLDVIMENRVAGVIASVAGRTENSKKYKRLESLGIPVVLFDRFFSNDSMPKVVINNYQGAFDATEFLIHSGRKLISFYRGKEQNPVFEERYNGYLGALKKHKIPFKESLVFYGDTNLEDGIKLIHEIKREKIGTNALLSTVDKVALGVITGARDINLNIPEDLFLIGFDNEPAGRIIRPALTTVAQPVEKIGQAAFDLLLKKINNESENYENEIILNMELIKRNSTY